MEYKVKEYVVDDFEVANRVLLKLVEVCNKYTSVSVADYYDLLGMPSSIMDNSYGWRIGHLSSAKIISTPHGGYIIELPPAIDLMVAFNQKGGDSKVECSYCLEIMHEQPGDSKIISVFLISTVPPFYTEGTSISVNDICYVVMDTLVVIEKTEFGLSVKHQVRVK